MYIIIINLTKMVHYFPDQMPTLSAPLITYEVSLCFLIIILNISLLNRTVVTYILYNKSLHCLCARAYH